MDLCLSHFSGFVPPWCLLLWQQHRHRSPHCQHRRGSTRKRGTKPPGAPLVKGDEECSITRHELFDIQVCRFVKSVGRIIGWPSVSCVLKACKNLLTGTPGRFCRSLSKMQPSPYTFWIWSQKRAQDQPDLQNCRHFVRPRCNVCPWSPSRTRGVFRLVN
jgi:hypothetical protein